MTTPHRPRVACFGYINPGEVFSVDKYPAPNTGAYVTSKRPFIGADCAMAAQALAHWGVDAHLIANALGNDAEGRATRDRLEDMGVRAHLALRNDLRTLREVDISDLAGTRTFFVEDNPAVWDSLADADLSAIDGADMLYVDWYVGPPAARAIAYARARQVPVFLNVEYSLHHPDRYRELAAQATYAQSPMSDVHVGPEDPMSIAMALCGLGAQAAFVTRGKHGSLMVGAEVIIEVPAPAVEVVDAQGAGAVFSAAAMYGLVHGWPLERVARVATAAASRKCAQHGLLVPGSLESLSAEILS
jgi:sugar/nucleoside kinase (ribokinase family)